MKVYIVHGWDGNPQEPMLQWIKTSLESRDYDVSVPTMPDAAKPMIEAWVEKLTKTITTDTEDMVLIGHSLGCQAILRYLEATGKRVKGLVLIAPWMVLDENTVKEEGEQVRTIADPWMHTPIDFAKIRSQIGKVIAIFSTDDKYVPVSTSEIFEKELGAKIVIEKKKGHFTMGDGIMMLPSAVNAVMEL